MKDEVEPDRELEERDDEEQDEQDEPEESHDGGSSGGVFGELKNVASDAALAVLAPVAKQAITKAAEMAVKRGPELLEDKVMPALEDAGGPKALLGQLASGDGAGGLLSKLTPGGRDDDGGGGDAGDGTGKGRRMPVQQAVDVAAPIDIVYDQWTQFEDYPRFMHRVERVEQRDETHVSFHAKVWGINRTWEAEIVEQRPDERIVFKSVNGVQLTGAVTFHDLAERLTRVEVNIDLDPDGPVEKIARGARFVKRATRGDLKRFKAFVEMHEDETGAWRGEIQEGDVVSEPGEAEDEYDEDEYEDEPEAEYYDEYDEEEYEEEEPVAEEEEDEEKPRSSSRSGSSRSSSSGSRSSSSRSSSSGRKKASSSSSSSGRKRGSSSSKSSSGSSSRSRSRGKSSSRSRSSNGGDPKGSSSRSRGSSSGSRSGSRSSSSSKRKSTRGKSSSSKSRS